REIADEVGAKLMVDMVHYSGLVAAGLHDSPIAAGADVVTTTTHKTLRGPRGGLILAQKSAEVDGKNLGKVLNSRVFPGTQGGPLMHVIAGKAICFGEALHDDFRVYMQQVIDNAKTLAETLMAGGLRLVSGGTDNHLMLVDVTPFGVGGQVAEEALDACGITCNKNMIPFDERKPMDPSGIRLGTPALTTRGMREDEMRSVGAWIIEALQNADQPARLDAIREQVKSLCGEFPVPAAPLAAEETAIV
ncbi:MAG: serine hydroxymethyltransferase, partial [Planctomycetota bacterium]